VDSNWVHSALRPPIGLLCQPRVIMMMEKLVEWLAGETEELGENLTQCHCVHHKPHILCPDVNPGRCDGKPATNRLSYGTAHLSIYLSVALQPFVGLWPLFQLLNLLHSRKYSLDGDQSVARLPPAHRTAQTQRNAQRHPCLKWDSNPRSQCLSGCRRFMPETVRSLRSAARF
jgi:hypothetical protein